MDEDVEKLLKQLTHRVASLEVLMGGLQERFEAARKILEEYEKYEEKL